MSLHVLAHLLLVGFPLRFVRSALHIRGLAAHLRKDAVIMTSSLGSELSSLVLLDNPVNLQIRIAPDRGCKMAVIPQRQTKMPAARRRIHGPLHAAQRHYADGRLLRLALQTRQKRLELLRMNFTLLPVQAVPVALHEFAQGLHFFLVRHPVCAENKGDPQPVEMLRNGFIGGDHEIFDHHCGCVSLVRDNLRHVTVCIQMDFTLRKFKINGAVGHPLSGENAREAKSAPQHGCNGMGLCYDPPLHPLHGKLRFDFTLVLLIKKTHNPRIRQLGIRADHRFCNPGLCDISGLVHPHDTAEGKPVLTRIQGADAVGKLMGQHRNHAVHQIIGGGPLPRLKVQCRILPDIFGNVGNMYSQLPGSILIPKPADRDGIVNILGIRSVNGHCQNIPPVLAALRFRAFRDHLRDPAHLLHNLLRKALRKVVGPHDRQDIDSRIIHMPQDLRHLSRQRRRTKMAAAGALATRKLFLAVIRNMYNHLVAIHRTGTASFRNTYIRRNLPVVRYHASLPAVSVKGSYNTGCVAGKNGCNLRLQAMRSLAAPLTPRKERCLHHVAVQSCSRLPLRNEQVLLQLLHSNKAKASGVGAEGSLHDDRF